MFPAKPDINPRGSAVDENSLDCKSLHCSLQVFLCKYTASFSYVSVESAEDKTVSLLLPLLRFSHRISCSGSNPGGILKRNTFLLLPLSASGYLTFTLALIFTHFIYSAYIKQNKVLDLGQGPEGRRNPPPPHPLYFE